jgi:hypothetical protein
MKIVINDCYGGFGLSKKAYAFLGIKWDGYGCLDIKRNDPRLVRCVETLGEKAASEYSKLKVVQIPDDVNWHIEEYDGLEHVAEDHRTWP